jgi:uncharacterized membrane protein YfcA
MEQLLWLIPLGFGVGTLGTLIGAGGGFILVPVLLLLYPDKSPETITSISLAVVFFNAVSGTSAYAKMKRIDYKSGLIFAAAGIPGSLIGAMTTSRLPRQWFDLCFGVLMVAVSTFLALRTIREKQNGNKPAEHRAGGFLRKITDADGIEYLFSYNLPTGIIISVFVGFLSSMMGIGGGIIHVPAMINLLNFPVHIATATSHFMLIIMSFTGSIVHVFDGVLLKGLLQIFGLALGVIFGARLGARLSRKVKGSFIVLGLACALGMVGLRLILTALW